MAAQMKKIPFNYSVLTRMKWDETIPLEEVHGTESIWL